MNKKIISIDLDGVLNEYIGDYIENEIPAMKKGAYEFLKELSENYRIEIFTTREKDLVRIWLINNNLYNFIDNITNIKNSFTSIFLDDRAITFTGDYFLAKELIDRFTPYWKNIN